MSRGNRREAIFREDGDYTAFIRLLGRSCKMFKAEVHSFCLMTNHFHLLLSTSDAEIWKFMCKLTSDYAKYFNRKYKYSGHLFEKRYTSCLVTDDVYLLEVSRYIHLNPVKAQMVRSAIDYAYSSYRCYLDEVDLPFLNKTKILEHFADNDKEKYRIFVESRRNHAGNELYIQRMIGEDENWLPW